MPTEAVNNIISAIDKVLYSPTGVIIQLISAVISIVLITIWIRLLLKNKVFQTKASQLREAITEAPVPKRKVLGRWKSAQKRLESNDEGQWKLAILEADAILDELIRGLGYSGETMGERMKKIKPKHFPHLDDAWRAHKIRNFIAHDPSYTVRRQTAEKTIEMYRKIFEEFHLFE